MIIQLELMPQIKIVLDKMQIHHVNIIHLNLEPVDVVDFLLVLYLILNLQMIKMIIQ